MKPILIFAIIFSTISIGTCTSLQPKGHGESCSKRKECDTVLGLRCLKGSCQCHNPDAQVYSPVHQSCLIKIGRRCGNEDEEENSTASNSTNSTSGECVENGECRKLKLRKWCRCKEGFMSNSEGTSCTPISRYGESCGDSQMCEKRSGTQCINGKCQCPFGGEHQYYDQLERKCISYANKNCSLPKISGCVKNAECVNLQLRTGYTGDDGVQKIHVKSVTQCHCVNRYSEFNGFCMASAEMECNSQESCNSGLFLSCVDGKCKCRNPLSEIVDENSGQCASLVGSSCQIGDGLKKCVENAECIDEKCQCKDGYSTTNKKTCLLSYKQPCKSFTCNNSKGMACIDGFCECFDSNLIFDNSTQACVGLSSSSD